MSMKPDSVEETDAAPILQKPNALDEPIVYDKPNTYDEDEYEKPLPQEVLDDLIVRAKFINGKRPDIKTNEEEEEEEEPQSASPGAKLTSSLLSHVPSSTTSLSTPPPISISPSVSSISSNDSNNTNSSATRQALLQILKKKPMEEIIQYDLRKQSLTRPFEHDVYFKGTKIPAYKKIQPHSYSWGFQNVLYRLTMDGTLISQKHKVSEARRRAFKKSITVEWGDFPLNAPIENEYLPENESDLSIHTPTTPNTLGTKSGQLLNRTNSHLLFTYDTEFEGFMIRWKRTSLLSHDLICQIRPEKHLDDNDEVKKKWRVIAEFDSHRMGYFIYLGQLIIDKNALALVDRPDHLESHIIVTCCTLIDLMREVVEKAVGLNKGGVVGSD
ncbi:hypothetical protein EDC96DRAFT_475875 [Choanephora cucurbitarum]|nr:hypothetical protein EDC96DRAFT_475875 [Choanephora cucurbitarum]